MQGFDASGIASLLGVGVSLIMAVGALIVSLSSKDKNEAEAAQAIQSAASSLVETYKAEVARYQSQVKESEGKIEKLTKRVDELEKALACVTDENQSVISGAWLLYHQVHARGDEPMYTPPEQRKPPPKNRGPDDG